MQTNNGNSMQASEKNRRMAVWGTAAFLLLLPFVAMQFSKEVSWTQADFLALGTLLSIACATYELATRMSRNSSYRAGMAVAVVTGFFLAWLNLAVGIIGNEDNPANLMFGGVFAVGIIGALMTRFRACGMAITMVATMLTQALVAIIAMTVLNTGLGNDALALMGVFGPLWLLSAWLFRKAARDQMATPD